MPTPPTLTTPCAAPAGAPRACRHVGRHGLVGNRGRPGSAGNPDRGALPDGWAVHSGSGAPDDAPGRRGGQRAPRRGGREQRRPGRAHGGVLPRPRVQAQARARHPQLGQHRAAARPDGALLLLLPPGLPGRRRGRRVLHPLGRGRPPQRGGAGPPDGPPVRTAPGVGQLERLAAPPARGRPAAREPAGARRQARADDGVPVDGHLRALQRVAPARAQRRLPARRTHARPAVPDRRGQKRDGW